MAAAVLRSANPPADLSEFRISRETVRRARASRRRQVAAAQRGAFVPPPHAVVHWDGKLVKVRTHLGSTLTFYLALDYHNITSEDKKYEHADVFYISNP